MPPKRQSPLELNPPSASSSDSESEDEQPTPTQPIKCSTPKPPSDSDSSVDDEEDSESGSESDSEPVKHMIVPRNAPVATEAKPISSRPMSTKAGTKRSVEEEEDEEEEDEKNDKNMKKKKVSDIEEEKKVPFQRPEDEILLLNSLIEYKKDGHNFATDMGGFLNFVKDSLKITVNKAQLQNKIQSLEKKFVCRGKGGKDPVLSKPHELKSYELSKEIWGDGVEVTHLANGAGKRKMTQVKSNGVASPKKNVAKILKSAKVEPVEEEEDNEKYEDGASLEYPYLSQSMQNNPGLLVAPEGLAGLVAKKGWDLMGASNAEALDKKWKSVLIDETNAYIQRIDLVIEQTKQMLDVLESSDN